MVPKPILGTKGPFFPSGRSAGDGYAIVIYYVYDGEEQTCWIPQYELCRERRMKLPNLNLEGLATYIGV